VDENRAIVVPGLGKDLDKRRQAVALDRADVPDPQLFKNQTGKKDFLDGVFDGPADPDQRPAEPRDGFEERFGAVLNPQVVLSRHKIAQVS
jgi:hypothetical protein